MDRAPQHLDPTLLEELLGDRLEVKVKYRR